MALPTPRQAEQSTSQAEDKEATLRKIGWRFDDDPRRTHSRPETRFQPAFEMQPAIEAVVELLMHPNSKSVLLIGSAGVGKSALIKQIAHDKQSHKMADTEFWQTSGSRIVAGMSGFGEWQQRCQSLIDELKSKNAILHLGNLIDSMRWSRLTRSAKDQLNESPNWNFESLFNGKVLPAAG